jgi:hypothetical protein
MKPDAKRTEPAPDERVLLACDHAIVTNRRVVLKAASFAAPAISSVKVQHEKVNRRNRSLGFLLSLLVIAFGVAFGVFASSIARDTPVIMWIFAAFGGIIALAGLLAATLTLSTSQTGPATVYAVLIQTIDGQSNRITGLNRNTAKQIADAISSATALR